MKNLSVALLTLALPLAAFANDAEDRRPRTGTGKYSCGLQVSGPVNYISGSLTLVAHSSGSVQTAMYSFGEFPALNHANARAAKSLPQYIHSMRFGVSRVHSGGPTLGTYLQIEGTRRAENGIPDLLFYREFPGTSAASDPVFRGEHDEYSVTLECHEAD